MNNINLYNSCISKHSFLLYNFNKIWLILKKLNEVKGVKNLFS